MYAGQVDCIYSHRQALEALEQADIDVHRYRLIGEPLVGQQRRFLSFSSDK